MTLKADGMSYVPEVRIQRVCGPGEFAFAAVHLDHGHIYGQSKGLIDAGGEIRWVYDRDPEKVKAFCGQFPQAKAAPNLDIILDDPKISLITAAAVPHERGPLGCRIMEAGKDYFTDKAPFTSLAQLEEARKVAARTRRKYMAYYGERLHSECGVFAGQLIEQGVIGRVIQVIGTGPHRLNAASRPAWFFEKDKYGGILCDIGSHQCEQFLFYTGAKDATVNFSATANFAHGEHPGLEDFGEASLTADNGASGYFRVDWFTPDGLRSWGDGRTIILGTKGYMEMRKYINVAAKNPEGNLLYLVDHQGEQAIPCAGRVGCPFFGELILDSLNRTEIAMTQEHAFKAAELSLIAQSKAVRLEGSDEIGGVAG